MRDKSGMEPAAPETTRFASRKRKPSVPVIIAIALLHLALFYGLLKALAPDFTAEVEQTVLSGVTVTITAPPEPPPTSPEDEGAAGDPGANAVPRPTTAPSPERPLRRDPPQPRATSTGTETRSGATEGGDGTGAGGTGSGTGAGGNGTGRGGGIAVRPSVRSGELNQARDFPVPEGGRQARFGKSVTVVFTVTVDGRATNCSVASSGVDAETTAQVCPLVESRIRFNPARRADGTPVEARYGYRVDFSPRG